MKFIHIADVHWGMAPDGDKPWCRQRTQAIRHTFERAIEETRNQKADLLLIAGDLFHRQPLVRDLKEVNYLFTTIPDTKVVIIAGNHDRIQKSSAVLSFQWAPNVTYLMDEEFTSVYFEEINTEVWGFSYHTAEIREPKLNQVQAPGKDRIHILLGHGGDAGHVPIDRAALAVAGFSYVALGHIHKPEVLVENRIAYSGSPEPLDKTETGKHGIIIGEISNLTGNVTCLKFLPMAEAQYIPLNVNVTPATTNTELTLRITQEILKRGSQHIYRFRIRGMRDPDIEFDLESLVNRYRIAEIVDESEPRYDFSRLFAEHPSDMIGFFIQALQKDEMSAVEKKALHYGIHALLLTTDERN